MIKVLHFIYGLKTGGAETLVKNYLSNFDCKKFDMTLLCLEHTDESPYEKELKNSGIRMIFVEDYLLSNKKQLLSIKFFNRLYRYFILRKILATEHPDIIHTHLYTNHLVRSVFMKDWAIIFHTIHSDPKEIWRKKEAGKDFLAAKWLVRNCDMRFIVLHERMRNEINKMFGVTNSIVLNNGVDIEKIKNAKNNKTTRKELGISDDAFVLGHIGRFSEVKNHEFLVDIFKEIRKKNSNAFLLMVGDGLDKDKIVKKLNSSGLEGRYLILSNRSDIPDLLRVMDVFVFPSLYEGLPLSLIEAQIARKPCFISDGVDESTTISNLVTRLPLEDGATKWADTILSYRKPKKVIVNEDEWDIKKNTKQLEQIYMDALAEKQDGKK